MDLIQSYHDQESQSSSSDDESRFLQKNATATPSTSYSNEVAMPKMVSTFEPLERIPIDRLMIATAAIAAQKPTSQKQKQKQKQAALSFAHWLSDIEKDLRMCLGSIQTLQKHTILESMDRFISKLTKDYEKIIKPNTADFLSHYIRTYLHIYKYLFRSLEKGKRYYKRFIKILSIYTDLELCASLRGAEYDKSIAERIVLIYQTYLDHSDNSMVLDVLLNTKRLWRQHRGILVLLFEYFLVRKMPIELPDTLFMKNLIMFKKWLYIEEVPEERRKARDAFVKCVKPKKTICMNSLFKPYLPVDEEGFVTIADSNDILNKEYALAPLIRCIKKAELRSEVRQNEEIIILTDDEDEDDSFSNHEGSSATCSHHDDMSYDFDWYSASSQMGNQSSHSQNVVETVSIDSPPPAQQPSYNKNTPSLSSLDSCDLNMDTTNSLVTDRNGESAQHSDIVLEKQPSPSELPSTSEAKVPDVNGENDRNLSTLDESMFNRLVNDINSTQVSIPGNGSASSDIKITENGESSVCRMEDVQSEKLDKENGILTHEPVPCSSNGDSSLTTLSSDHNPDATNETPSTVQPNHIDSKTPAEVEPAENCDNIISSDSSLKNHEETLKTINEVVNNDLKNHGQPLNESGTSNDVHTKEAATSRVNTASSPIPQTNDVEIESNKENENTEPAQANLSMEFVPVAESTASVINETSLLSKSEQDVLFKDRDAALIFNDLWSNGPTAESPKPEEVKSPRLSNDSPLTFLANGIDPNFHLKTYTRRPRRLVETKTISTQTSRYSLSGCPSPVTTIEENNSSKKDRYLLTERNDDELFLRDIFNTTELPPVRSGGSPRIRSPMYSSSTPTASTPIASTSIDTPNVTEHVQSLACVNASEIGSTEVVVKRKRGRPRKYPLPEPGTTPIVPKPPKAPRQPRKPRQPKPPKDPNEEEVVFEKRVLRERKPKQKPPEPEPVEKSREKVPAAKPKRSRRRNTIKMTIDAIFNTQTPALRAMQARRISQIFGIPMIDSQKIATILKRRNYNKSINNSRSINSDSNLNDSSMLQTFMNRSNGQMVDSTNEMSSQQSTPSTILARKTYIKPNITLSSFTSLSSALRRISFSARRMSFHTRRISFSATKRPKTTNRTTSPRKTHTVQRYSAIDIFDTSKKRGRKKGTKDSAPRKKSVRKSKKEQHISIASTTNPYVSIVDIGNKVNSEGTIELVDLTNEIHPMELDTTNEMQTQFANIHTALSSTQHTIHNASNEPNATLPITERRSFRSEDTETDFTNELTTDPESTVEDTDDSHTRKSKRCRKRPKILDL
ncbi:uncharacterized protein LOC129565268 [Sitodiplosis mosellana]|uniref:uncharacterized protein LOC129565268 n=1 Tax=Sitodiplosis mosellana TaxID=263140 RepID=UPI002443B4ED|nr:uncharacterized protein LOC129565268 [Sitodiplosis mosellana]